jgi:mono/diheme cytochrome c family protein
LTEVSIEGQIQRLFHRNHPQTPFLFEPTDIDSASNGEACTSTRKLPNLSGAQTFELYCAPCHSADGSRLAGPSFKNLWGKSQSISRNGRTESIIVNEDYLLESIKNPQAAVVKGYEQVAMANFSDLLSKEQLGKLIDHSKKP